MKYSVESSHAEFLDGGVPVAPGDEVELSDEDAKLEVNARLIEDGRLVEVEEESGGDEKKEESPPAEPTNAPGGAAA